MEGDTSLSPDVCFPDDERRQQDCGIFYTCLLIEEGFPCPFSVFMEFMAFDAVWGKIPSCHSGGWSVPSDPAWHRAGAQQTVTTRLKECQWEMCSVFFVF